MDNSCTFQINIAGNVFAGIGTLQGDFKQLVQVVGSVDKSINTTFGNIQDKVSNISLNAIIDQVEKVGSAIASISGPGIGFEQSMSDLSSITGIVGEDLQELSRVARQTGKDSGLGAKGAADAFAILASQIQVDKIGMEGLQNLQAKTITLSHAAGMSMNDAALGLAGTINQFGLQATEADRVINVLAAGSKYGAAEIVDLSQSFKVVGAAAAAAGLSVEDTAGAVEVLSKNNLKGAEAGTALRNIVLKMQTTLGVDFTKNSLSEALDALKPRLTDATYLSEVFGMENIAAAQFLIKNADAVAEMTEQVTDTNVAYEQAAIRTETTAQMMERCRAKVDDLKIGFFDLTGSLGAYATLIAEQAVTVSQLLPLFSLMAKGVNMITDAEKRKALWDGICSVAGGVWTAVQWALNASLWACPLTWIVAGIAALIAIVAVCATKVGGWGKQWDSIVNFMKAVWELFCESFKFSWNLLTNGIMIGLDYIKLGWYKFKEACGLGDSDENQAMINQIGASIEQRQQAIIDGAQKIKDLTEKAAKSLTWELSWKKSEKTDAAPGTATPETDNATQIAPATEAESKHGGGSVLNPKKKGKGREAGTGSKGNVLDLNKIVPNLKGSTAYTAIASRLSTVKMPAVTAASLVMPQVAVNKVGDDAVPLKKRVDNAAEKSKAAGTGSKGTVFDLNKFVSGLKNSTAYTSVASRLSSVKMPAIAASLAMPLTVAATSLPPATRLNKPENTEYAMPKPQSRTMSVGKFCDKVEIHIAKADDKGYATIEREVAEVLRKAFDDYEA